jgi:hypothetical protein
MGRLFDILLFDSPIRIGSSRTTHLYWSVDEPTDFHSTNEINEDAFHQMLGQLNLVLFNWQIIQCAIRYSGGFSGGKPTRMDTVNVYREHGLDVHSQAEEIKAFRRLAKEIEWPKINPESDNGDPSSLMSRRENSIMESYLLSSSYAR